MEKKWFSKALRGTPLDWPGSHDHPPTNLCGQVMGALIGLSPGHMPQSQSQGVKSQFRVGENWFSQSNSKSRVMDAGWEGENLSPAVISNLLMRKLQLRDGK